MYKLIFPLMMISLMISAPLKKDMHSVKKVILPPKNLHFYLIQASCLVMKNMYSVMSLASLTRNFLSLMTCIDEQVFWNKNTLFLTELKIC